MAKKHIVDYVNQLKESGINVSFTKPRSQFILTISRPKHSPSITIKT